MNCRNCNADNEPGGNYCFSCGCPSGVLTAEGSTLGNLSLALGSTLDSVLLLHNDGAGSLRVNCQVHTNDSNDLEVSTPDTQLTLGSGADHVLRLFLRSVGVEKGKTVDAKMSLQVNDLSCNRWKERDHLWDRWCKRTLELPFRVRIKAPPGIEVLPSELLDLQHVMKAKKKHFRDRLRIRNIGEDLCEIKAVSKSPFLEMETAHFKLHPGEVAPLPFSLILEGKNSGKVYECELELVDTLGASLKTVVIKFRVTEPGILLKPIFGIDYGNSTTKIATFYGGEIRALKFQGREDFSSAIYVNERGKLLIGTEAERHAGKEGYLRALKGLLSQMNVPEAAGEGPRSTPELEISVHGQTYKATDLIAQYLAKTLSKLLKGEEVQNIFGRSLMPNDVLPIATHPVAATETHLSHIKRILADLGYANPTFFSESTAAAFFYALGDSDIAEGSQILVFDCGAGTTDITVLQVTVKENVVDGTSSRGFQILSEAGVHVGGNDFDKAFYNYVQAKLSDAAPGDAVRAFPQYQADIERAKKDLSGKQEVQIILPGLTEQEGLMVSRQEFEGTIFDHVAKMMNTVQEGLDRAGLSPDEIERVYLVGGSTHIPLIKRRLEELFGNRKLREDADRLTCVAKGAVASQIDRRPVLPFALGYSLPGSSEGRLTVVLPKGSNYPAENIRRIPLACSGDSLFLEFVIYRSGENNPRSLGDCMKLGKICCEIDDASGVRASEVILHFSVRSPEAKPEFFAVFDENGLNKRFDLEP